MGFESIEAGGPLSRAPRDRLFPSQRDRVPQTDSPSIGSASAARLRTPPARCGGRRRTVAGFAAHEERDVPTIFTEPPLFTGCSRRLDDNQLSGLGSSCHRAMAYKKGFLLYAPAKRYPPLLDGNGPTDLTVPERALVLIVRNWSNTGRRAAYSL